jgi:hypothetical protein
LKRLAMRTGGRETASCGDEVQLSEERVQVLEACPEATNNSIHGQKSTKQVVNLGIQSPESSASRRVRTEGRGGAEKNVGQARRRGSDMPSMPQPSPFRLSVQHSLDCHFADRLSEYHTVQPVPTDANIPARPFLVSSDQNSLVVKSISGFLHTPEHAQFAQRSYLKICEDDATPLYSPENDTDSLDQFDIQLLGIDNCGHAVSGRMIDGNELTGQDPPTVKDLISIPGVSANPKASDTANTDTILGGPKIHNHQLENYFVMHPSSTRPIPHPLGNTSGLISRRLEEPAEEAFTGFSRPHMLY